MLVFGLRKMELGDLNRVIAIIDEHDDDDAEAAEAGFEDRGFEHYFVFEADDKVVGVTGFIPIEATDNSYWLSWTYIAKAYRGRGFGRQMLETLIDKLKEKNARKLFVKVSDYSDTEGNNIYAAALGLYKALGFTDELTATDYYDKGESLTILSYCFDKQADFNVEVAEEKPDIRFNGLFEIEETEGSYSFSWTIDKEPGILSRFINRSFTVADLRLGIEHAGKSQARNIFLSFPSNLPLIHRPLQVAGFDCFGQLKDYYESGVDELHYVYRFT